MFEVTLHKVGYTSMLRTSASMYNKQQVDYFYSNNRKEAIKFIRDTRNDYKKIGIIIGTIKNGLISECGDWRICTNFI